MSSTGNGIGHGAWGTGHWALGMGHGARGIGPAAADILTGSAAIADFRKKAYIQNLSKVGKL
ncbi:hypothetical protein [Kamptonema formosum]|uniref:hypothetical protein n=1 Tax=Kamptonema formosum TaxID=331992 RepID=UPI000345473C|nr:hypothetical protein [Oscillatoria sp. PCC 10802]